jgi:hypothetical protein
MNLRDEELKDLYRSYITMRTSGNREGCPSPETLLSFFVSRSKARKKLKIVDHLTNCSACAKEFELLLEIQRYQDQLVPQVREATDPGRFFRTPLGPLRTIGHSWKISPILAGAIFVIASLIIVIRESGRPIGVRATSSSIVLVQPDPIHSASLPLIFIWKEVKGAETYVLELYDDALLPVWKSREILSPPVTMPEDLARQLQLNKPYFWMITAYQNKEKLAESELTRFIVRPKEN